MNVSNSLQNSFTTPLFQSSQHQHVQSQDVQNSLASMSANKTSADSDGDNDNENTESSSAKEQNNASSGFNSQSVFSGLNQNGSKGISAEQLLNALLKQSTTKNITQNNNLQDILMNKIHSSYSATQTLEQSSNKVLSA